MYSGSPVFGAALILVLSWAVVSDLRARSIPNLASAAVILLWLLHLPVAGKLSNLPSELLAAAAVFAVGFASWRAGLLGGGDVKLLTALAFWVGGSLVVQLVLLTALAGGALAVASLAFRSFGAFVPPVAATILERVGLPVGRGASATLPYGVAIGVSGGWLVHRLFWI